MSLWKFSGKLLLSAVVISVFSSVSYADTVSLQSSNSDNALSYYAIGDTNGFVYNHVSKKYKQGAKNSADVLLIGEGVKADQALITLVNQALQANKTVIFDGNGSASKAQELAQAVLGNTINADAIQFRKAPGDQGGYSMTPIVSGEKIAKASTVASSQLLESKVYNPAIQAAVTTNTVENILP